MNDFIETNKTTWGSPYLKKGDRNSAVSFGFCSYFKYVNEKISFTSFILFASPVNKQIWTFSLKNKQINKQKRSRSLNSSVLWSPLIFYYILQSSTITYHFQIRFQVSWGYQIFMTVPLPKSLIPSRLVIRGEDFYSQFKLHSKNHNSKKSQHIRWGSFLMKTWGGSRIWALSLRPKHLLGSPKWQQGLCCERSIGL